MYQNGVHIAQRGARNLQSTVEVGAFTAGPSQQGLPPDAQSSAYSRSLVTLADMCCQTSWEPEPDRGWHACRGPGMVGAPVRDPRLVLV